MKPITQHILVSLFTLILSAAGAHASHWTDGMKEGKPAFKSIGHLAFGPEDILFVADTKAAALVALATGDTKPASGAKLINVEGINQKIAALLGTTADQTLIDDLAVNPVSHNVYLAVSRGRGPDAIPVLIRVKTDGQPEVVSLEKVKFSRAELPDAPIDGVVGQPNRQTNPRLESITDIAFLEDRVLIAGLSNEEFASTFRAIPFPFKTVANGTSVEIYHGSHGRFETRSPVRTFVPFKIGNEPHLVAAYTCTPLVEIPVKDLKPGAKIKGKTIAELGNGNRPLDMIVYAKDGKHFILMANSARGVMKLPADNLETFQPITKQTEATGVPYETIAGLKGVQQLDKFDDTNALVLMNSGSSLDLKAVPLP